MHWLNVGGLADTCGGASSSQPSTTTEKMKRCGSVRLGSPPRSTTTNSQRSTTRLRLRWWNLVFPTPWVCVVRRKKLVGIRRLVGGELHLEEKGKNVKNVEWLLPPTRTRYYRYYNYFLLSRLFFCFFIVCENTALTNGWYLMGAIIDSYHFLVKN